MADDQEKVEPIHPSGEISKADCLDAANNLIADLRLREQLLQTEKEELVKKNEQLEKDLKTARKSNNNPVDYGLLRYTEIKLKESENYASGVTIVALLFAVVTLCSWGIAYGYHNNCERAKAELCQVNYEAYYQLPSLDIWKPLPGEIVEQRCQTIQPGYGYIHGFPKEDAHTVILKDNGQTMQYRITEEGYMIMYYARVGPILASDPWLREASRAFIDFHYNQKKK